MRPIFTPASTVVDSQIADAVLAEEARDAAADAQAKAVESRLEGLCWSEFEQARIAKDRLQQHFLDLLRARKSEYSVSELTLIRAEGGGSEIFVPLPQEKCATAIAWLGDLYFTDRFFDCEASPVPELPPQVMQIIEAETAAKMQIMGPVVGDTAEAMRELMDSLKAQAKTKVREWAQKRADNNAERIWDEMVEGGLLPVLRDAYDDLVGLGTGFVKGPVVKMTKELAWAEDYKSAKVVKKARRTFESPSPFDVYPAPGSGDVNHSHISIRLRLQAHELSDFAGVDGFKADVINEMIARYGTTGLQNWWWDDQERADLESRTAENVILTQPGLYDVIEHYTYATGKMLKEFGIPDEGMGDSEVYSIVCWMLNKGRLIGARINDDPLGKRPIYKMGFRRVRGSFWADGVVEIMGPLTRMANAAARSLANNLAMAAGFYTEIQVDRLAQNEKAKIPAPYGILQTVSPLGGTNSGPAVYTHQAAINAQVYIAVYGWVSQVADAVIGLPSFMSGISNGGGAGDTSSGLAQLTEMATRTFKYTVADIDQALSGLIDRLHTDLVLTNPDDPELNGDMNILVKGTKAFGDRQAQRVRLNELVQATNNPTDIQIMGPEGRAQLLRTALEGFDGINLNKTIPNREEIIFKAKQAAAAAVGMSPDGTPAPGGPPAQGVATQPDGSVMGGVDRGVQA